MEFREAYLQAYDTVITPPAENGWQLQPDCPGWRGFCQGVQAELPHSLSAFLETAAREEGLLDISMIYGCKQTESLGTHCGYGHNCIAKATNWATAVQTALLNIPVFSTYT